MVKEGLFSFTYVQYTLECRELKSSTIRKLSDIEWFKDKLKSLYPATYFPPLPKKTVFENSDSKATNKKLSTLNRFFDSLLQSEEIRSAEITKDFITLPQKEFENKKKVYDKLKSPEQIRQFITMDGYVDIRINKKIEEKVLQINTDITNKINAYTELLNSINALTTEFQVVTERIKDVSKAFKALSDAYKGKINSGEICDCYDKFVNFANKWKEGYEHQIKFFNEDLYAFFKYISKELNEFKPIYDEFYMAKGDYEEKNYQLDKNRNNPTKVEESKKEFLTSRTCYGFILNRCYDEYYRVNGYHGKIISRKLDDMDEDKSVILHDYISLIQILGLK
ncbi:MAG: PX domain-containing protein [archaeon]|nr:PX domain-containing protein [archaeon]